MVTTTYLIRGFAKATPEEKDFSSFIRFRHE
jgi:hypothetical protein